MSQQIKLHDLTNRSSPPTSWSYNAWKTRLVLNFKSIPYTTIWLNHNTLAPTLSSLGLPASPTGFPYTVPTISFDPKTHVTDSAALVRELEVLHPVPSLHLDPELETQASEIVHRIAMPLFAEYMPRVARDVILPETVEAFRASREKRFGATLEEMKQRGGGEKAWAGAEAGFTALKAFLVEKKVDEGPWVKGGEVCYADFVIVAMFESFKRVGLDMFERAIGWDDSFAQLYDAARKWTERDD